MIRCTEGHFYDPGKHHACPWCPKPVEMGAGVIPGGKTVPLRVEEVAVPVTPLPVGGKTVPLMRGGGKVDPVVGWLVCVEGPERGQDFRLKAGKNFLGRSAGMDVCVAGDETVSRDKHAVVMFEPKKAVFWVGPGESSGLVYCNGEVVHAALEMKAGDVVEVGQTKLMLVPFATGSFRWEL